MKTKSYKNHVINALLVLMLLILSAGTIANAQDWKQGRDVIKGYKGWEGNPDSLSVNIDPNFDEAQKADIRAAMKRWNDAGCTPKFKETSSTPAHVSIKKGNPGKGAEGVWEPNLNPVSGKRDSGKITVRTTPTTPGLSFKELVTHELGHALGLDDTKNASDTMVGVGANGTGGNLSKHDTTEMKAAAAITYKSEVPQVAAIDPAAIPQGVASPVHFNVGMLPIPQPYPVEVTTLGNDDIEVLGAVVNGDVLEVMVLPSPFRASGTFYLDVLLQSSVPPFEQFEFIGYHYVNSNPVPLTAFDCNFTVVQDGSWVNLTWNHTYPFPGPLRSTLLVNGNPCKFDKVEQQFEFELAPGVYELTLVVDDHQVNSASQTAMFEMTSPGHVFTLGIGTAFNTATGAPTPYGTLWKNVRQQYLIRAAELTSLGVAPGPISAIAFDVANVNNCSAMPNYTIQMKHTMVNSLSTTFDNGAYQQVWTHPNFLPVNGWNTHTFETPFTWDGERNILIDLCFDLIPGAYTQNASVYFTPTPGGFNSSLRYQNDNLIACGTSSTGTTSLNRANMQITALMEGCLPPGNLTADNISESSAVLGWTPVGNQTSWNVEVGLPGFVPGTGQAVASISGIGANQWTVNGLNHSSTYQFYVQGVCVGGDLSNWSEPREFATLCGIIDPPFSESFPTGTFPNCWTQTYEGGLTANRWSVSNTVNAGGLPWEMKALWADNVGISRLISPPLNCSGAGEVMLEFKHYYDDFQAGCTLKIQSSPDKLNWSDEAFQIISGGGNIGPVIVAVPISLHSPTTYIAWTIDGNHYMFNLWFIDDVTVTTTASNPIQIFAGKDYYTVPMATFGFGAGFEYPPLEEEFFGPGSEPFEGAISFEGQASGGSQLPYADMDIQRMSDYSFSEPLPSMGEVPVLVNIMNLKSKAPIVVHRLEGGFWVDSFFDVFTEIGFKSSGKNSGVAYITLDDQYGGSFSMTLSVQPTFRFVNVANPAEQYFYSSTTWLTFNTYGGCPWTLSPIPGEFDPISNSPVTLNTSMSTTISLIPLLIRENDNFYVEINESGTAVAWNGNGFNNGEWYNYLLTNWINVWFYDHPMDVSRQKYITFGNMTIAPRPGFPGNSSVEIVFNSSTPQWPDWRVIAQPPLPFNFQTVEEENLMIQRTNPLIVFNGTINEPIPVPMPPPLQPIVPTYNPEWLSVDIRGYNFILMGNISHVCFTPWNPPGQYDFGDAPESDIAYLPATMGQFPTCQNTGPAGFISHGCPNFLFFGGMIDCEGEGNAGNCPVFSPNNYNVDECGTFPYPIPPIAMVDEGLMFPIPLTIVGQPGQEQYIPCGANSLPLGMHCTVAYWGQNIDIWIDASQATGLLNVLFDWDRNGIWTGSIDCPGGITVPEHSVVNFAIPAGFIGPVSLLNPPEFMIGPDTGPVWARFSLTEQPVLADWDGSGQFADGETEDYLLDIVNELYEFGDAPPPYPTLLANNGAHHANIGPNIWMGNFKDFEPDGIPHQNAIGDDNFNLDDEDGVSLVTPLIPGQNAQVHIQANWQNALLHAWVDFNCDGDWSDPGEQIFADLPVNLGHNALNFIVPFNATSGTTYARFRINTQLGTPFFGYSPNGEVEDYKWIIEEITDLDFGDAPDPSYPTLLSSDGARHIILPGMYLGASVDPEPDGQPDLLAAGDDLNGSDDEDGVKFLNPIVSGGNITIEFSVIGAGYINGWIDWNANGLWSDPGDHIIVDLAVSTGLNTITVLVPSNAVPGMTYTRFRYSSAAGLTFTGLADDGEVEDYQILIQEPIKHKMHYPQYPKFDGLDVEFWSALGDDFQCTESGPVGFIRFWISYKLNMINPTGNFTVMILSDIPAYQNPAGYSKPGNVLWARTFMPGQYAELMMPDSWQDWFELPPGVGGYGFNDHTKWNQITISDITDPFIQTANTIYWLVIDFGDFKAFKGWKESAGPQWNDAAVYFDTFVPGGLWKPLIAPGGQFIDFSFVIDDMIADDILLQNITIPGGQIICYEANNSIITGGYGSTFIVQNGAVVHLIAGNNVILKDGTHFQSGSYVHAYIDLTGEFCTNPKAMLAPVVDEIKPEVTPIESGLKEMFFNIYPNPTTGQFTLELAETDEHVSIKVEIFSLIGESIINAELPEMKQYLFDLSAKQPGIYLLRVMQGSDVGVVKVIRH